MYTVQTRELELTSYLELVLASQAAVRHFDPAGGNIKIGDEIRFRTSREEIRYRVTDTSIVQPDDVSVLEKREKPSLTLITCYPFYYVGNAPRRFIIHAERL